MSPDRPAFLITMDTEGDNLWARPHTIATRNAEYLPRFQQLCERFGFKPTWLTDWDMINSQPYREFALDVIARGAGEIGMHLHAWNSPPLTPLTEDDMQHHPYLIEFAESQIREKVKILTDRLEEVCGVKMLSHRAGRWGFNDVYARVLVDHGYRVDCSVTPHMSWRLYKGDPRGQGGPDFSNFPEQPYLLDLHRIDRPGDSPLLEVPVTVMSPHRSIATRAVAAALSRAGHFGRRVARRFFPRYGKLIPNGCNLGLMLGVVRAAVDEHRDYAEFMLHSSELMPGGSPNFPDAQSIERLYEHLELLFETASRHFQGMTLAEYHTRYSSRTHSPTPQVQCTAA